MQSALDIAIAGCGIGGLATAAFLARAGHAVTLYDRFERPEPVGSGLVLQPVGLMVMEALGLREQALALGHPIDALIGEDAGSGRRVLDVRYDHGGAGRFGLGMHRAALFALLHDAALAAGARLSCGREVVGAGAGRLQLAGPGGTEAEGPFDLILDATGATSPLAPQPGRALPFGALWATVPANEAGCALRQRYRGARYMAGVLPVGRLPDAPETLAAIFWSLPVAEHAAWRAAPFEAWRDEAAALWPEFATRLRGLSGHDDLVMARYRHRTLRDPVAGRLLHLGDAWHAASPQLGQGANMALLDAMALSEALERAPDPDAALGAFRRARGRHVTLYQLVSRVFTPLYQSESRILPALRDHLLAPAARLPGLRGLLGRMVSGDMIPPIRRAGRG